ncbi:tetratricopeptide repeat protein [Candidatus Poribacteria bacterium]|nr:tetratricopeptide repeat protein [Candidatus Poribacteria bacterium]
MKNILCIIIIFITFIIITDTAYPQDDYFRRIAEVSDGRLTRFSRLPIKVYIQGSNIHGNYMDDIKYALKEWQNESGGTVKFHRVYSPEGADISISWVNKLEPWDNDHPLGVAELQRTKDEEFYVEIRLVTRNILNRNQPLDHKQMRTVILHEIGHAIGLWGHSEKKSDVMYYSADAVNPTSRDIKTLKRLYAHESGHSLHAETIEVIKEQMQEKPDNARLHFMLGTVYADQGEHEKAIETFKLCLKLDSGFHKASAALASSYRASGRSDEALTEYLALAETQPSAMLYNVIGAICYEKNETWKAVQYIKKALETDRSYEPARGNLYRIYLGKGQELTKENQHYAAIKLLKDGVSFFPDRPELYNALGIAYAQNGDFSMAIRNYTKALNINPAFTTAKNNLATSYNNQGTAYAQEKQWSKALDAYSEALRLMPDMAEAKKNISAAYWNQATYLSGIGKEQEAIESYRQFLVYNPDDKDTYNNLGALYYRSGNYKEAARQFRNALKADPRDQEIKNNIAVVYHKMGLDMIAKENYSEALDQFMTGLEFSPNNVNLLLSSGYVYKNMQKWDEAEKSIQTALEIQSDNEDGRKLLANLYMQQGNSYLQAENYDKALEYFQKVPADLTPPQLHSNIGYVFIKKQMYFQAAEEFDKTLEAEPKDDIAYQNLETLRGSFAKAFPKGIIPVKLQDEVARVYLSLARSYIGRGELAESKRLLKSVMDMDLKNKKLTDLLAERLTILADALKEKGSLLEAAEVRRWAQDQ